MLTHRVIVKQQGKREQTHHVYLHAVEKYEKVSTQNDYKTTSKQTKHNIKIKKNLLCWFCKSV